MERQRNIQQVKKHDKCPQPKKRGGDKEPRWKKKMRIDSKDDPKSWKQNENKINRLETRIQQMQEMFNKDQEEILKRAKQ